MGMMWKIFLAVGMVWALSLPVGAQAPPAARRRSWGPEQATGAPDTHRAGDIPTAWASLQPDGGMEWLQLAYPNAVVAAQVRIHETFNPGAVCKVAALDARGAETVLWEGQDPTTRAPAFFEVTVDGDVRTHVIKVYVDARRKRGWNEIDAVELVGRDGSRQWATTATASTTYAERGRGNSRSAPPAPPAAIPPHVVAVDPPLNSLDVDPGRRTISVTFDRDMRTERAWSWMSLAMYGLYPSDRQAGDPRFDETGRTCTLSVSLRPEAVYAIGVNSSRHRGFADEAGIPAVTHGWAFATGGYQAEELPPHVVRTDPPHGANDVDPACARISVTFDRPMRRYTWSWVKQSGRGAYPGREGAVPEFSEDGLTCSIPVNLSPGTIYALAANGYRYTGFKSRGGAPSLPFGWAFKTSGQAPASPGSPTVRPGGRSGASWQGWRDETLTRMRALTSTAGLPLLELTGAGEHRSVSGPEGVLCFADENWLYIRSFSTHTADPQTILARDRQGNIYSAVGHACPSFEVRVANGAPVDSLEDFLRTRTESSGWEAVEQAPGNGAQVSEDTASAILRVALLTPGSPAAARKIALRALVRDDGEESWAAVMHTLVNGEDWGLRAYTLTLVMEHYPDDTAEWCELFADTLPQDPFERGRILDDVISSVASREGIETMLAFVREVDRDSLFQAFERRARNCEDDQVCSQLRSFRAIRNSVNAYGILDPERSGTFYRSLLGGQTPSERAVAIYAVGELRVVGALTELTVAEPVHRENCFIASSVLIALGKLGTTEARDEVVRRLVAGLGDRRTLSTARFVLYETCGRPGASPRGTWEIGTWVTVAADPRATAARFAQALNGAAENVTDEAQADGLRQVVATLSALADQGQ
ncbi:MAG: Ig-like domain-containing protein [Lentisphaerae bacterium]|jgi:hypothetical protein|nr:Ig-like domain-containing protein [Lentisphaerota bacterium]MBT4816364.1 Ig-like domain-containing protein [Lentisphaerota bacterium]MBT5605578.1 Ig-like domain-containing protein [Lentisphaerota bacterium]MBT7056855.1 Ig-like domain-containing protein [Lentisphaerota bacterium]MBT7845359.1 Ig-like domain-containing protein [Lentisphaerota bacterium]